MKIMTNPNDKLLNDIVNYVFMKQNELNTYSNLLPKDIKEIREFIKEINNEDTFLMYNIENDKVNFVSIYAKDVEEEIMHFGFIACDNIDLFNDFKETVKEKYKDYNITIFLSKFHKLLNNVMEDDFFITQIRNKKYEIYETKLNKLKYRMNEDYLIQELPDYMKEEFTEKYCITPSNQKNIHYLVCLANNELVGYFEVETTDDYIEINDYYMDYEEYYTDVVFGKVFVYLFDKYGKYKNIQLVDFGDFISQPLTECGCILIEENYIFSSVEPEEF